MRWIRHLWMYPKYLFAKWRCRLRGHADPTMLSAMPVQTRRGGRVRVEMAVKTVCSRCGAVLSVETNRSWRRQIQRGVSTRR